MTTDPNSPYTVYHESRNRKTGSTIQIIDNRDFRFTRWLRSQDEDAVKAALTARSVMRYSPFDYITYCTKHGAWVEHHTLKDAGNHYAHPEGWCDECAKIIEGSDEDPPPHRTRRVEGFDPATAPEVPDADLFR
jgi:hypothetical protein